MSSIILNSLAIICFVAGKSGGHLLPCATMAKQIQQQNPATELYLFSTGSELDHTIVNKHQHLQHYVPTSLESVPYGKPWLLPFFCGKVCWYFCKSLYKLWKLSPQKVISFGGFNSIPVCCAAKILGIPIELYELNVEPGKATQWVAKLTSQVFICFSTTKNYFPHHTCTMFDYPVRFTQTDRQYDKLDLLKKYNFFPEKKTVLILGGSQGSILLNEVMKDTILQQPEIAQCIQIIHQTGNNDPFDYQSFYQKHQIPSQVFTYHEQLQDCYNLADIIISRAGAGTLFEIKFFKKPCIVIPHETANTNHQIENVRALQEEYPDMFCIIPQSEFSVSTLLPKLQAIT